MYIQGRRVRKSETLYRTDERGEVVRDNLGRRVPVSSSSEAKEELARRLASGGAVISRENEIRQYEGKLERLAGEVDEIAPAISLDGMFDAFVASPERPQRCSDDTLERYGGKVCAFVEWMRTHYPDAGEMRQVTDAMARKYLAELGAKVSGNTYNKTLSGLKLVWKTIGRDARCGGNPWEGVRRKYQTKDNGRRALTVEELARVCGSLRGEMRLLFALGLYFGQRLGDCALLEWGAVDLVRGVISLVPRKTAKSSGRRVVVPIHKTLLMMLCEIPAKSRRGYVLPETARMYLRDSSNLSKKIQAEFERAGIRTRKKVEGYKHGVAEVGFHSLRHSFVSMMGNAGVSLALVQRLVGHGSPMMTDHYFHERTDALALAVGSIPALTDATQNGGEDRLHGFRAAFLALTPEDRQAARQWIDETCDKPKKEGGAT